MNTQTAQEEFEQQRGVVALADDILGLSIASRNLDDNNEPTIDCRLQYHNGHWQFCYGDASCDVDHRGHWGSSRVGVDETPESAAVIAKELLEQVLESIEMNQEG